MRRVPGWMFVLMVCPGLSACRGSMVQEYRVPSAQVGGQAGSGTTVLRTTAHGPAWALSCLAQQHTFGTSAVALQGQVTAQDLSQREAWISAQMAATHTAGRDLAAVVNAAGSAGLSADERLRALNVVGTGLGASQPFRSVAEAQAFLDLAASGAAR